MEGLSASASGKEVARYTSEVVGTPVVRDANGKNVTGQFTIEKKAGYLNITPKAVTVTADSFTKKVGEGEPIFTATIDGIIPGDSLELSFSREPGEAVGTYKIFVSVTPNKNYTINTQTGTLTIASGITIQANSATEPTTARKKSVSGYQVLGLPAGYSIQAGSVSAGVSGVDAKNYAAEITGTPIILNGAGEMFLICSKFLRFPAIWKSRNVQ